MTGFLRRHRLRLAVYGALAVLVVVFWQRAAIVHALFLDGRRTVADVLKLHGPAAQAEFEPRCRANGIPWPPKRVALLVFKTEKVLEAWGADETGPFQLIKSYPVLGASGTVGPKRRSGDHQVPEGFYEIEGLNPNSQHHLSIKVGYPNRDDRTHALVAESDLGGDIFIHGGTASIGCVAMGDPAIEELFSLVAQVPPRGRRVLLSPVDFRSGAQAPAPEPWIADLYARLAAALRAFPASDGGSPGSRSASP